MDIGEQEERGSERVRLPLQAAGDQFPSAAFSLPLPSRSHRAALDLAPTSFLIRSPPTQRHWLFTFAPS